MTSLRILFAAVYLCTSTQVFASGDPTTHSPVEVLQQLEIQKFSGKPVQELWNDVDSGVSADVRARVNQALKENPNLKVPEISIVKMEDGSKVARMLLQNKDELVTIEFRQDPKKALIINGLVFTQEEMDSPEAVALKLSKEGNFKEHLFRLNFPVGSTSDLTLEEKVKFLVAKHDLIVAARKVVAPFGEVRLPAVLENAVAVFGSYFLPMAEATVDSGASTCRDLFAKICWDPYRTNSYEETVKALTEKVKGQQLPISDVYTEDEKVSAAVKKCDANSWSIPTTSSCSDFRYRQRVLDDVIKSSTKPAVAGDTGQSSLAKFWDSNKDWIKTALMWTVAIVTAVVVCRKAFHSCGVHNKSTSANTGFGPTNSNPTAPPYDPGIVGAQ